MADILTFNCKSLITSRAKVRQPEFYFYVFTNDLDDRCNNYLLMQRIIILLIAAFLTPSLCKAQTNNGTYVA